MQATLEVGLDFYLDGLSPGTTYYFCVASDDCQNDWNCGAFSTLEDVPSRQATLYKMDVFVEGSGTNWIQLSWPPPKVRRPATPPIGYVICLTAREYAMKRIIFLSAPWVKSPLNTIFSLQPFPLPFNIIAMLTCSNHDEECKY